jgi:hypothetical protein
MLWLERNPEGLNYCTNRRKLFLELPKPKVPTWIWGAVTVLFANWQILHTVEQCGIVAVT